MKIIHPWHLLQCGRNFDEKNAPDKVSSYRRILPQFLSAFAQNLLSWNLGLVLAFPSIVVPSVIGISSNLNPDETLHMTPDEASWLASLLFMVQPIGNLLSGFIADSLGRKKAILFINIVPAIGWILLPNATSQHATYFGFALLGIGVGLTSSITYVSEISEPSIRGVLNGISGISTTTGMFMIYLLGSFFSWRQVSYVCAIIPILNILVAFFIPEAPIWLLSKDRSAEAQRTLQMLRGWVSTESISPEFEQLKQISQMSASCESCTKLSAKCTHPPPKLVDKFKDMTKKRTLKPFALVTILFLLMQFTAMFAMRPYIVQILSAHGISLDANLTTTIIGVIGILANVCIVLFIRTMGKRRIYLYSMVGNFLTCFGLCIYGWIFFPRGWSSIDISSDDAIENLASIRESVGKYNYFALAMFLIMQFCVSVGVSSVPYFMMSEVFPFKSRPFYCGFTGALNQLFAFVATKTYYDLERWMSLPGVEFFYGIISVFGYILMIFMLPETEQRSLEDIELHFSDNKRSIFDINIAINTQKTHVDKDIQSNELASNDQPLKDENQRF